MSWLYRTVNKNQSKCPTLNCNREEHHAGNHADKDGKSFDYSTK